MAESDGPLTIRYVDPRTLQPAERNPRIMPAHEMTALKAALERWGFVDPIVLRKEDQRIIGGHQRVTAAIELGMDLVPVVEADVTALDAMVLNEALNRIHGTWDPAELRLHQQEIRLGGGDLSLTGFTPLEISILATGAQVSVREARRTLAQRFVVPPFSVLDARQGYWQARKRDWLALGIQSELGRGDGIVPNTTRRPASQDGAWQRRGGRATGPFDDGSWQRDHAYSTRANIGRSKGRRLPDRDDLTPVEEHGGVLVKRDDLYEVAGVNGGKARTAWALAQGARGLVTAGSRASPQVNIVAQIARALDIPCRVHVPTGPSTPDLVAAEGAGAEVLRHPAGYNSVIVARARADAADRPDWRLVPFGMECDEAATQTARQVANLPADIRRIVVPVGSGMSLAGIVMGLRGAGRQIPILGVTVGASPMKRLDLYAPGWRDVVTLQRSPVAYSVQAGETTLGDLGLDPIYEAKCLPYLQEGDLLWVVGIRQTQGADAMTGQRDGGPRARTFGQDLMRGENPHFGDGGKAFSSQDRLDALQQTGDSRQTAGADFADGHTGTSIFDPVLSELAYRWFCPAGGAVLDPFAGGSVRGIVASVLGRGYTGIDLSPAQLQANREQAAAIVPDQRPTWVEGDSRDAKTLAPGEYDFVFSCPPYHDLEVYSDDPRDISTMEYGDFLAAYRQIIAASLSLLKPDRFACFVVGDVRDRKGILRNFVAHTAEAFRAGGAVLYNEAILVTAVGSLPVRVARQFAAGRKLGKTHQNVLVFVKGDPKAATEACGPVEVGDVAGD